MNFCSNLQLNLRFKSKKVWSGQPGEGSTYIQRRQLGAADVASITASTLTALVSLPASELKPWHSVPQLPPGLEMPFCASGPSCVPSLFARRGEQLCFITFFRVGNLWVHFTARAWLCRAWYRHDLRLLSNGVKSLSLKDWMPPERGCTEPSMLFTRGREDWNQRWCSLDLPEALPSPKCCVCNWDCSPLVTYSAAASSCLGSASKEQLCCCSVLLFLLQKRYLWALSFGLLQVGSTSRHRAFCGSGGAQESIRGKLYCRQFSKLRRGVQKLTYSPFPLAVEFQFLMQRRSFCYFRRAKC